MTMSSKKRAPEREESEQSEKDDVPIDGAEKNPLHGVACHPIFDGSFFKVITVNGKSQSRMCRMQSGVISCFKFNIKSMFACKGK